MALVETLASQAGSGDRARLAATRLVERLAESPQVEIIPKIDAQFQAALEGYAARPDQRWSLTDCASFIVIEERDVAGMSVTRAGCRARRAVRVTSSLRSLSTPRVF